MHRTSIPLLPILLFLGACSSQATSVTPAGSPPVRFPDDTWLHANATGIQIEPPAGLAWRTFMGDRFTLPTVAAGGWSRLQPIVLATTTRCPELPGPADTAASVATSAPVLLLTAGGTPIPWFGEPAEDPRYCRLYPLDLYPESTTVVVVVTRYFAAPLAWSGGPGTAPVADAVAWWRFTTGSDRVLAPLFRLRDAVEHWADAQGASLVVSWYPDPPEAALLPQGWRLWKGSFQAPAWTGNDGRIHTDTEGNPLVQGTREVTFYAMVATTVTSETGPLPVLQYGHGLFGDPRELLYPEQRPLAITSGALLGAIAWGMATRYFDRAIAAMTDPTRLLVFRDKVWEGLADQLLWTRVLHEEVAPRVAAVLGRPVSSAIDYLGSSQGAILGSVLAALSPRLRRMVLHVGGGNWTPMMIHSTNWTQPGEDPDAVGFGEILAATIPDPVGRTFLFAAWQLVWDQWDGARFAPYWQTSPTWSTHYGPPPERRIYYPYALSDPVVPNFSSEVVLRASQTPLLTPVFTAPWGIALVDPPADLFSVAGQWDIGGHEVAHNHTRALPAFVRVVREFLRTGIVEGCAGPCRFPPP